MEDKKYFEKDGIKYYYDQSSGYHLHNGYAHMTYEEFIETAISNPNYNNDFFSSPTDVTSSNWCLNYYIGKELPNPTRSDLLKEYPHIPSYLIKDFKG